MMSPVIISKNQEVYILNNLIIFKIISFMQIALLLDIGACFKHLAFRVAFKF